MLAIIIYAVFLKNIMSLMKSAAGNKSGTHTVYKASCKHNL